jgi:hypothetical protein
VPTTLASPAARAGAGVASSTSTIRAGSTRLPTPE